VKEGQGKEEGFTRTVVLLSTTSISRYVEKSSFFQWFQAFVSQNLYILDVIWVSDALFYLLGYVNPQNIHMWAAAIHEDSFISRKWAYGVLYHVTA
jgi:hypothetical protein